MATITMTLVECDAPTCRKTIGQEELIAQMDRGTSTWWQGRVWQQNEEPSMWAACGPGHIKAAVQEAYALSLTDDESVIP